MSATTPQLSLDDMVCFPLYAATRAVTRAYADLLAEVGLTYPQYLTMLAVWEAEEPRSVRELGDRLMLDSGTLTPLLKRLEVAGHVVRRRDERDERRVLVSATERGEQLRAEVAEVPARLFAAMGLELAELVELRERLGVLLENLGSSVRTDAPAS
ncbi:MarR family winged helix-turn-helix transcriptional regulator [Nocardioides lianchengensis]|uniref:DNA-binding transcriptional regulator, MarR family n=1 Tax=Nocardioides lianchengensis TaxID=1045774 RepID=A0A1G6LLB0_9ACTN|nr:MarR family winged helix-turn-helix transcriptional regulator [Nocardioides lianchengensis]NYG12527.1 DNA-binding MarR family transcriptional regulator [Nocardioides lianchengensis]SDC43555.1 DNA-binding transcriptional regulator, MarR family [Nocardioides lianchengensis]